MELNKNGGKMKNFLLIAAGFMSFIIFSCGTTKGYLGETLPKEQTVLLKTQKVSVGGRQEFTKLYFVNTVAVGSYDLGWPDEVYIKPSTNTIEVGYYNSSTASKNNGYSSGGLLGVALQNSLISKEEKERARFHKKLDLNAILGHSYIIKFYSQFHSDSSTTYWIEDEKTGEIVSGEKPTDIKY
jgi:hypothetical protein